jgi:antagonist of KipI
MDAISWNLIDSWFNGFPYWVLEVYPMSFEMFFEMDCELILCGGEAESFLNNVLISNNRFYSIKKGSILKIKRVIEGRFVYVGIGGTLKTVKGNCIDFEVFNREHFLSYIYSISNVLLSNECLGYLHRKVVRFYKGKDWDFLTDESKVQFLSAIYIVSSESNRMGYRLKGANLILNKYQEKVSSAVSTGSIQLLPNGQCVVVMADGQTTGGYPIIGHVVGVDIAVLAQKNIHEPVRFDLVSIEDGENLLMEQDIFFKRLRLGIGLK